MKKNIYTLLQDAIDICKDLGIEIRPIISNEWNTRLKAVWGRCRLTRNGYQIELNSVLADECVSWEDAMNTVIHEVLHCHENRFCHTGEWKRCAELVNREYEIYHISRCTSAEEKGIAEEIAMHHKVKWQIVCQNCGCTSEYLRAGKIVKALQKNPKSCWCGRCKSANLKLIEVK